jgi:pimeloyl-ACP methyl ester carboxylesterase
MAHVSVELMPNQYWTVRIPPVGLDGTLAIPAGARGLVLFAHGSGSSRFSPRNNQVATALLEAGLGTLLFDLLLPEEATNRANVFDIGLLAGRLRAATDWAREDPRAQGLSLGYFGASTGAAAALVAAAGAGTTVRAIVSRGGRPDLAGDALEEVVAPTLLIVGGADVPVLELNGGALARLRCEKELKIVPGATHLFEEPGALEEVMAIARDWFAKHLVAASEPAEV